MTTCATSGPGRFGRARRIVRFDGPLRDPILTVTFCLITLSGCGQPAYQPLLGRWSGTIALPVTTRPDGRAADVTADDSAHLTLELGEGTFQAWLEGRDGSSSVRAGQFTVRSHVGSRWELRLQASPGDVAITLALVLDDADHLTVRQVGGDDRLASWTLTRMPARAPSAERFRAYSDPAQSSKIRHP